ncbi:hypothetical protein M404DRAFT_1006354 [Pisolithus tinctorius Marx 270]|uniref:Uncharacterized protein n=1 Tax=Pisolithus tinctorius Marx 270 TaxID=870435 RepID=A0A0C3JHJ3_PISTI|nr:hypothetical protein M404DRAFT_1006354 [Pisolithus tinctorius Marx 270]
MPGPHRIVPRSSETSSHRAPGVRLTANDLLWISVRAQIYKPNSIGSAPHLHRLPKQVLYKSSVACGSLQLARGPENERSRPSLATANQGRCGRL